MRESTATAAAVEQVTAAFDPFGTTPENASMQCVDESLRFVVALTEAGVEAELLAGFRAGPDGDEGHTVARVGDVTYDWTARQFTPDAPLPLVLTYEEFTATWVPDPNYTDADMRSEVGWWEE